MTSACPIFFLFPSSFLTPFLRQQYVLKKNENVPSILRKVISIFQLFFHTKKCHVRRTSTCSTKSSGALLLLLASILYISSVLPTTARPSVLNGLDLSGVEPFFHTTYLWQYHCFPFLWAAVLYKYVHIYAVDLLINVYQNRLQKYYIKCIYQSTYLVASILSSHLHTLLPIIRYIKRSDSKLSLLIGLKS